VPLNEDEKSRLKDALHQMNNALNSISMQAELARMYAERNDSVKVGEALSVVMAQCRQCSSITRTTQELFNE
jgi:hypothetical protein